MKKRINWKKRYKLLRDVVLDEFFDTTEMTKESLDELVIQREQKKNENMGE